MGRWGKILSKLITFVKEIKFDGREILLCNNFPLFYALEIWAE